MRDITTHVDQLQEIQDDPSQSQELGVNQRSLLMDIHSFDICSGVLVCNVMHDLFEGLLPYETMLLLRCFIEKEYFTLSNLNCQISSLGLTYGTESDKPNLIDRKSLYSQGS